MLHRKKKHTHSSVDKNGSITPHTVFHFHFTHLTTASAFQLFFFYPISRALLAYMSNKHGTSDEPKFDWSFFSGSLFTFQHCLWVTWGNYLICLLAFCFNFIRFTSFSCSARCWLCCVSTLRELQSVDRLCRAKKTSLLSARVDYYFERKIKEKKKTFNAEFLLFFRSLTYKTHSTTPSAQLSASSLALHFQLFFSITLIAKLTNFTSRLSPLRVMSASRWSLQRFKRPRSFFL